MSDQPIVLDGEPVGITPKVKLPAQALGVIGIVLLAASYLVDGLEPTRDIGYTLVAASPFAGVLGYRAQLGPVTPPAR